MPRPSEPAMHDAADKDIHSRQGVAPYPAPKKTETATEPESDTVDPATTTPDAPHDRGTATDGRYATGIDAMKQKLKVEGEMEDWKDGRTQGSPQRR